MHLVWFGNHLLNHCNRIRPLVSIEFLYLQGSKLSGPIPSEFGRLSNVGTYRLNASILASGCSVSDGYFLTHSVLVL